MRTLMKLGKRYSTLMCVLVFTWTMTFPSGADDAVVKEKRTDVRTVAILVFNGMDIQDFAGPADVFFYVENPEGKRAFKQFAVAKSMDPITSQGFVKIVPNYTFDDCPKPDILVIPGGFVNGVMNDEKTMAWIKDMGPQSEQVL